MQSVPLNDVKARLSSLVDAVAQGAFVTLTRPGKPVAALVPIAAAGIARAAMHQQRPGLAAYLKTFPGGLFERNPARRGLSDRAVCSHR